MTENKRLVYEFGKFLLDPNERVLLADGQTVRLTAKEFATLLLLVENNGRALTKDEMIAAVWHDAVVEEGNLAKQISRLRKTFDANGGQFIETLPKHGYRFSADVRRANPADSGLQKGNPAVLSPSVSFPATSPRFGRRLPTWRWAAILGLIALMAANFLFWTNQTKPDGKITTVAVLPLRSLTHGGENDVVALGLTDALITKLGSLKDITVRPFGSVNKFAGDDDALEIGRKLNVDAVLEGSIQEWNGRWLVNARLINTSTGEQIWGERFEDSFANAFDVQDRVSEMTARALMPTLTGESGEPLTKRYTGNPAAFDAYLRGRYYWNKRTEEDLRRAVGYFEQAITKDANYALAYAGLADSYTLLADYSSEPTIDSYEKARQAAVKALELDESLTEAQTSLAYIKMYRDWDWKGADDGYRRAIALNPNYATARQWYSEYLTAMGRFDDALAEIRRAREIDPLSPIIQAGEVWVLYFARRYDEAIEQGRIVAELNPDFAEIQEYLKRCYDQKGMYTEAIAARQTRRKLAGRDPVETTALKTAAAASSVEVYWKKRLEQEINDSRTEAAENFNMAEIHAQLGEKEKAFEWLKKAYEDRDYLVMYLKVAPNLDPIRADPRFSDLLRRMGLPN